MPTWEQRRLRLSQNHGWKARRGHKIIVVDRGAVRLEVPRDWVVTIDTDESSGQTTIKVTDRPTPDDDCRLQVSMINLPPGIDWSALPLTQILEQTNGGPDQYHKLLGRSMAVHEQRRDVELAWIETRFVDPGEDREARSRTCVVRRDAILAVITLDYWSEDAGRFLPVWEDILRSLRLAEYVQDPTQGPAR